MREFIRDLNLDEGGNLAFHHNLKEMPDFVHIMVRSYPCTAYPAITYMDSTDIVIEGGTPELLFDALIIKDHSIIK